MMSSFLGSLFSWPVLVGIVAAVAIILVLSRLLVNKPKAIQTVLSILEHASGLIEFFMPDKYKEVYEALITAVKRVSDGVFTQDEAISTAREVLAVTLKELKITLTDEEAAYVDQILVFVIEMIAKDKTASVVAIKNVCVARGFKL